ncbi:unnamed protein product, partial [Mesorhabditis belari]|uniref:Guanylate-binding protein N-terminal domain-containing protein n=1 Tax=Mesorhabditis belari TaxID=2138241 RepID=A0AAF3EMM0_9BILA
MTLSNENFSTSQEKSTSREDPIELILSSSAEFLAQLSEATPSDGNLSSIHSSSTQMSIVSEGLEQLFAIDDNGKTHYKQEVAVLLIDTQGTFDLNSDPSASAVIFTISLLMASCKIFNATHRMDAQDLDSLNSFINYSRSSDDKVGQLLLILLRDTLKSGLSPDYLEMIRQTTRSSSENQNYWTGIENAFDEVACFMAPTPSREVQSADGKIFAKDCGPGFLDALSECAAFILSNLMPKTVLGTTLTGDTLMPYVDGRTKEKTRANRSRYRDVQMAEAVTKSYALYEKSVKPKLHERLNKRKRENLLKQRHEEAKSKALENFDNVMLDFVDEEELVRKKRGLLLQQIDIRHTDMLNEDRYEEFERKCENLYQDLLRFFQENLQKHLHLVTVEEQIPLIIEICRQCSTREYVTMRDALITEVIKYLNDVSPKALANIINNNYEVFSVQLERCANEFATEARHRLTQQDLCDKVVKLEGKLEENRANYASLQENFDHSLALHGDRASGRNDARTTNGNVDEDGGKRKIATVFVEYNDLAQQRNKLGVA